MSNEFVVKTLINNLSSRGILLEDIISVDGPGNLTYFFYKIKFNIDKMTGEELYYYGEAFIPASTSLDVAVDAIEFESLNLAKNFLRIYNNSGMSVDFIRTQLINRHRYREKNLSIFHIDTYSVAKEIFNEYTHLHHFMLDFENITPEDEFEYVKRITF